MAGIGRMSTTLTRGADEQTDGAGFQITFPKGLLSVNVFCLLAFQLPAVVVLPSHAGRHALVHLATSL